MSTIMLLYRNVTVLSREAHKHLKLDKITSMAFAAHTHWMPIAGGEFGQAVRDYPIVFVSEDETDSASVVPIIVLGLRRDKNDYVSGDGQWKQDSYLPAFVRRYPFVVANTAEEADAVTICFDASFNGLGEQQGRALFNEDGSNGPFLDEIIQFMRDFKREMERTQAFVAELQKLDLLEKKSADIRSPGGAFFQVKEFLVVSEEKFANLNGNQLAELHQQGFLGWIFAHLMSLANFPRLVDLHMAGKVIDKTTE